MQKSHRSTRIPRMLLEWLFFVGLLSIIALLLSRILFRTTTAQERLLSSSAVLATELPISTIQTTSRAAINPVQESTPVIAVTTVAPERPGFFDGGLVGQEAPDFTLPTLNGDELTLSSLRGQAVWINFWASWCVPCRIEMPLLIDAYERYRSDGLVILGLNVTEQDTLDEVNRFVDEFNVPYPIVLDQPGHVSNDSYNLIGIPMSVFIDRAGVVKRVVLGGVSEDEVDTFVAEILGEASSHD